MSATARDTLRRFDEAIMREDADGMAASFCRDGEVLFDRRPPITGRDAIRAAWRSIFDSHRTIEYTPAYPILDEHGDRAYALATYVEWAESRATRSQMRMDGRAVYFLRREPAGGWCVSTALNTVVSVREERADADA